MYLHYTSRQKGRKAFFEVSALLDEWFEKKVDEACEAVPAYANPRKIRLANSAIGWRLYLYGSSMKRAMMGMLIHIRSEDDMNRFMEETAERSDDFMARASGFFKEKARLLAVLDDAGMRLRFATTLFLFGLAALGTLAAGGREMALCALMVCLMLVSAAMELGYEPICGNIRQRYLFSVCLRTLALSAPLADYFPRYIAYGVLSNVVLQSAMLVTIGAHLALFCALILFNRRQPILLRLLSGVLGIAPALTAASGLALAAAGFAQGQMAAGILRAAGVLFAFFGDRLMAVTALGGIRLKYESVWEWLLICGGLMLMMTGAWMNAAPI